MSLSPHDRHALESLPQRLAGSDHVLAGQDARLATGDGSLALSAGIVLGGSGPACTMLSASACAGPPPSDTADPSQREPATVRRAM